MQGGGKNKSSGSKQNIAESPMTDRYEPLGGSDGLMDSAIAQPLADAADAIVWAGSMLRQANSSLPGWHSSPGGDRMENVKGSGAVGRTGNGENSSRIDHGQRPSSYEKAKVGELWVPELVADERLEAAAAGPTRRGHALTYHDSSIHFNVVQRVAEPRPAVPSPSNAALSTWSAGRNYSAPDPDAAGAETQSPPFIRPPLPPPPTFAASQNSSSLTYGKKQQQGLPSSRRPSAENENVLSETFSSQRRTGGVSGGGEAEVYMGVTPDAKMFPQHVLAGDTATQPVAAAPRADSDDSNGAAPAAAAVAARSSIFLEPQVGLTATTAGLRGKGTWSRPAYFDSTASPQSPIGYPGRNVSGVASRTEEDGKMQQGAGGGGSVIAQARAYENQVPTSAFTARSEAYAAAQRPTSTRPHAQMHAITVSSAPAHGSSASTSGPVVPCGMAAVALLCLDLVLTVSIFNARLLTPLQAGADCQVQCDSWRDGVHIAGSVLALVVVAAHRALRLCALGGTRISGSAAVAVLVVLVSGIASCVVDVVLLRAPPWDAQLPGELIRAVWALSRVLLLAIISCETTLDAAGQPAAPVSSEHQGLPGVRASPPPAYAASGVAYGREFPWGAEPKPLPQPALGGGFPSHGGLLPHTAAGDAASEWAVSGLGSTRQRRAEHGTAAGTRALAHGQPDGPRGGWGASSPALRHDNCVHGDESDREAMSVTSLQSSRSSVYAPVWEVGEGDCFSIHSESPSRSDNGASDRGAAGHHHVQEQEPSNKAVGALHDGASARSVSGAYYIHPTPSLANIPSPAPSVSSRSSQQSFGALPFASARSAAASEAIDAFDDYIRKARQDTLAYEQRRRNRQLQQEREMAWQRATMAPTSAARADATDGLEEDSESEASQPKAPPGDPSAWSSRGQKSPVSAAPQAHLAATSQAIPHSAQQPPLKSHLWRKMQPSVPSSPPPAGEIVRF